MLLIAIVSDELEIAWMMNLDDSDDLGKMGVIRGMGWTMIIWNLKFSQYDAI